MGSGTCFGGVGGVNSLTSRLIRGLVYSHRVWGLCSVECHLLVVIFERCFARVFSNKADSWVLIQAVNIAAQVALGSHGLEV